MAFASRSFLLFPLLALTLLSGCGRNVPEAEPRPVMVAHPSPAEASVRVFPGEVRAREQPDLSFRVGGQILHRRVDVGERVRAGSVLAELDPSDFALRRDAVLAQLESARSDLALALAERDRYRSLLDGRLISRSDFDARQTRYEAAESRVRQAEAEYEVARNQSEYTILKAPGDGVVVERLAEAGQVVAAGQAVLVLAIDGEREVAISLPERDFARYRIGREVEVEVWADQGRRHPGRIRELAPEADPRTRTFAARIAFDAEAFGAELGQSVRVLVREANGDALSVPLPALARFDRQAFVWVVRPDGLRVTRLPVEPLGYREDAAIVSGPLSAESWVVVAGTSLLEEGLRVRPVDRENRPMAWSPPR